MQRHDMNTFPLKKGFVSFSSVFYFLFSKSTTLAELCYNFGVDTYYREEYESCIGWLR